MQNSDFINRISELAFFESTYQKAYQEAQFVILYGKRRVGKTELAKRFMIGKNCIYYLASKGTATEQLADISVITGKYFGDTYVTGTSFTGWRQYFDYLGNKLAGVAKPLVLVVDEFPYLAHSNKAVPSYFQYGWDEVLKTKKVVLILMGSSIAMMQKHTLAHKSPLYGRRTSQWLLEPFSFKESKNFYPTANFETVLSFYAVLGGIPAYLKQFNAQKSLQDNVVEKILTKSVFLNTEPELLISDEFDEPKNYLSILRAIGVGATKFSDILNYTGLQSGQTTSYLKRLIDLKVIKREVPVTEKLAVKSKMGLYFINDNFIRFYFTCFYPYQNFVETANFSAFLESTKETIQSILAKTYEEVSKEIVTGLMGKNGLPNFEKLGRWWDGKEEIDLVGLCEREDTMLFVEVKYTTRPLNYRHYLELVDKAKRVKWSKGREAGKKIFMLISKSGFEPVAKEKLLKDGVVLVEKDTMTPKS